MNVLNKDNGKEKMGISLDTWAVMIAVLGLVVAILGLTKSDVNALRAEMREDVRELREKSDRLGRVVLLYVPKSDAAEVSSLLSEKTQGTEKPKQ